MRFKGKSVEKGCGPAAVIPRSILKIRASVLGSRVNLKRGNNHC